MITNKRINIIIIFFVLLGLVFTILFMYFPGYMGIEASGANPEYAEMLFNKEKIQTIEISADESEWAAMLENALAEEYISCDIIINGETYNSVGIRPKGNSSLTMVASDAETDRFSFKIKMDEYVSGQNYHGLSKFVINNMQGDATYMKEYLSYDMFEFLGVESPLFAFADVALNGEDWGFYLAVEAVEQEYAQRNFGSDYGELYKPESNDMAGAGKEQQGRPGGEPPGGHLDQNASGAAVTGGKFPGEMQTSQGGMQFPGGGQRPEGMGGPGGMNTTGGGADLVYADDDIESYNQIFDGSVFKTKESDQKRVISALKHLDTGEALEDYVDTDEVLRYFAVNTALVNLDSYVSNLKHNYYLYEKDGQLSILPWDLNLSFAGFQSGDADSSVNFPIDTPVTSDLSLEDRPLIGTLLENESYMEQYHEYLQRIVSGYFDSGYFEESVQKLDALIGEHVKNDPTAFYTYEEYQKGVDTLLEFGKLRAQSIQGQLSGTIASTHEAQKLETANLVDASEINVSDMGSQGGGPMGGGERGMDRGGPAGQEVLSP